MLVYKGTNRAIAVSVIGVYTVRIEGISYKVIVE
jgi:helix-turn-helix protein